MSKNLKDLDFALLKLLNDLNKHYWPRGGMVTQRIANPFIPVRFWAWPPFIFEAIYLSTYYCSFLLRI